jgi:hypothetical protein
VSRKVSYLPNPAHRGYAFAPVLKTPSPADPSPRQRGFFLLTGFCGEPAFGRPHQAYGRECDGYKTRKGKKSARLGTSFQLPPALSEKRAFKSHPGANHE